jgi:hypothetical protein
MSTLRAIPEKIKEKDDYGYPITFNYRGSDTFQTFPGGLFSIFATLCVFSYFILKGKQMLQRENWTLVTQNVLNSKKELSIPYDMKDMKNVTFAL